MRKLLVLPALLFGMLTLPVATAEAETFGFNCISGNDPVSCQILEDQISVEVTDNGDGTVDFEFSNSGPEASSITDIYFQDDEPLFDWSTLAQTDQTGTVAFSIACSPPDLPSGGSFDAVACADADPPPSSNGVNPNESVTLTAELLAGATFQDVLDGIESGAFDIGVHVQAFANGESESGTIDDDVDVVDEDVDVVDEVIVAEPTTLLLLGSGLVAVGARFRRRR